MTQILVVAGLTLLASFLCSLFEAVLLREAGHTQPGRLKRFEQLSTLRLAEPPAAPGIHPSRFAALAPPSREALC